MAFLLYKNAFLAPLEYMPNPLMPMVRLLSVNAIQMAHPCGEICLLGFNNDVIVVLHQAPRIAKPAIAVADITEQIQPSQAVRIVHVNSFAPVAACRDVIKRAGEFDS